MDAGGNRAQECATGPGPALAPAARMRMGILLVLPPILKPRDARGWHVPRGGTQGAVGGRMLVVASWRAAVVTTAAALVVLVLVAGCGAVGVDTLDVRAASASAETACASTAAALCARTRECGPFVFDKTYASVATCTTAITAGCVDRYVGEGAAAEITDCSARVAASSCEGLIDLEHTLDPAWLLVACPVTPGRYPAGEHCLRDGDCTTGLCSRLRLSGKQPCGVCVEPPAPSVHGQAGVACSSDPDCASLHCADGRCTDLAKLGETCGRKPCDVRFGLTCGEDEKCGPVEQIPPGFCGDAGVHDEMS